MGNLVGFRKYSCRICRIYGIQEITTLFPFALDIVEKTCPFCKNNISIDTPTKEEIKIYFKRDIQAGIAKPVLLEDILIYKY